MEIPFSHETRSSSPADDDSPRSTSERRGVQNVDLSSGWSALNVGAELALNLDVYWPHRNSESSTAPIEIIDFFSGCGGMSAGFQALNALAPTYKLIGAVDTDADSCNSYRKNLGLEPVSTDVASLVRSRRALSDFLKAIDRDAKKPLVIIGCSPCQGFSSHRNQNGHADERNSLFLDLITLVERIKPDVVVAENVPELLTGPYWPFVEAARRRLERAGYFVSVSYHNLAGFGLSQERFRALVLGMRHPFDSMKPFLCREEFRTVRDAIGSLPRLDAGGHDPDDELHYTVNHKKSTLDTIRQVPPDGGSLPDGVGPGCLQRALHRNGKKAYEDVYGRLYWDRPAITITSHARNPASGRFVHPEQHRGLSVREAALLQGFPSNYWFAGTLDSRFRQIGNAVPPRFSAYLAVHIAGQLQRSVDSQAFDRGVESSLGRSFSRIIPSLKAARRSTLMERRKAA
jgi:DNA (cytosine-5)-methyltransferase 1